MPVDPDAEDRELVRQVLRDALKLRRLAWVACPNCKRRSEVEVRDSAAAVRAAQVLLRELESPASAGGFEFCRVIVRPAEAAGEGEGAG